MSVCPFPVAVRLPGAPGGVNTALVVPLDVADHGPSPALLTALTCTSYRVLALRPARVTLRAPDPVHTFLFTVQLLSPLLGASLRMWRKS